MSTLSTLFQLTARTCSYSILKTTTTKINAFIQKQFYFLPAKSKTVLFAGDTRIQKYKRIKKIDRINKTNLLKYQNATLTCRNLSHLYTQITKNLKKNPDQCYSVGWASSQKLSHCFTSMCPECRQGPKLGMCGRKVIHASLTQ